MATAKKKKPRNRLELLSQIKLFEYMHTYPKLAPPLPGNTLPYKYGLRELKQGHSIVNEGKRSGNEARLLAASGLTSGVLDIHLPIPSPALHPKNLGTSLEDIVLIDGLPFYGKYGRLYYGLYLEMKAPKGVLSVNQELRIAQLKKDGYKTAVCYSTDYAWTVVCRYLDIMKITPQRDPKW